jgi:nucleoside phosphorylase
MALEILLLEDDPSKKNRLLSLLNSRKELFGQIDTALCTSDAKRMLKSKYYDLFIADVVVPSDLGGEKSEENCIALFEELDDGFDGITCPNFSLPMSSSNELSATAHEFFKGRPWGILPYTDTSDECLDTIEKVARFVLADKERDLDNSSCDIFIITALMEPEFAAIESLGLEWGAFEPLDSSQLLRFGEIRIGDKHYKVATGFSTRMGPVASAILTVKALLKLKPKLVIMAGICAGIPGKAEIGDVIAADISWDWQSGKYIDKSGQEAFEIAPHQLGLDDQCRNQLLLLKRDKDFWNSLAPMAVRTKVDIPKLILGPMATGSSVLADARVTERIKASQHKNVVGLDMETYAVFAAANACNPKVKVMSLKSVCDKGDVKKNDEYQEYAANVSAATVFQFLKNYVAPLL